VSIERNRLRTQCAEAADIDLVRILTVDKAHSVTALVDEASRELERRQLTVEGFLDRVEVRVGAEDAAVVTIAQARSLISDTVPLHAVAAVSHALEETMVIQHEGWGWVFHHYDEDEYGESYLVDSDEKAHELLGNFLLLTSWQSLAGPAQHLDDWETVARSEEAQVVLEAAQRLTTAGIVHIVRSPLFTPEGDHHITLLVPQAELTAAEEALGISRQSLRQLKREATQLATGADREAELAVYTTTTESYCWNWIGQSWRWPHSLKRRHRRWATFPRDPNHLGVVSAPVDCSPCLASSLGWLGVHPKHLARSILWT